MSASGRLGRGGNARVAGGPRCPVCTGNLPAHRPPGCAETTPAVGGGGSLPAKKRPPLKRGFAPCTSDGVLGYAFAPRTARVLGSFVWSRTARVLEPRASRHKGALCAFSRLAPARGALCAFGACQLRRSWLMVKALTPGGVDCRPRRSFAQNKAPASMGGLFSTPTQVAPQGRSVARVF